MIDRTRVTGFDWDRGNARKRAHKHGVSQTEAECLFFNEPLLLLPDPKHSRQEPRYHALGATDAGRLLHITFTLRATGTLIRVISARDMHRKEKPQALYGFRTAHDHGRVRPDVLAYSGRPYPETDKHPRNRL